MNKVFFDSNILIYLYDTEEVKKKEETQNLVKQYEQVTISTQILFECCNVMSRKLKLSYNDIEKVLEEFYEAFDVMLITYEMIVHALKIAAKHKYSFPDSLIVSAALSSKCDTLFSEDMHNDHLIEGRLRIVNPFK